MLNLPRRSAAMVLASLVTIFGFTPAAFAGGGKGTVTCVKHDPRPECNVGVVLPGRPGDGGNKGGSGGGKGGDGKCRNPQGQEIPCQRGGGTAGPDGCYYSLIDLSPTMIEYLGGQPPGPGHWYEKLCFTGNGGPSTGIGGPVWVAADPAVTVSPQVLAQQAREKLRLPSVVISMNPPGDQLVNLPVWLSVDPGSWKPQSATASVPGVSVTATARPVQVTWSMGDGSTHVCDGPGTAWTAGTDPRAESPDCGHVYRRSSAGGSFTVSATVSWQLTWAGAGQTGTVPGLVTTGQLQTRVQESQAVISR